MYVFLSRTINPGVAFVMPVVETVILLYYAALAAGLIVQVGLSSFFGAVGMVSRNSTLISWGATVAKPAGVFWIGTLKGRRAARASGLCSSPLTCTVPWCASASS